MPGRDRTGPTRQGPITGRGMGFCGGEGVAGQGRGGGRGRGWRWRNVFHATGLTGWQRAVMAAAPAQTAEAGTVAPVAAGGNQQELAMLKQQADGLATTLDEIQRRIEELQGQPATPEPAVDPSAG